MGECTGLLTGGEVPLTEKALVGVETLGVYEELDVAGVVVTVELFLVAQSDLGLEGQLDGVVATLDVVVGPDGLRG